MPKTWRNNRTHCVIFSKKKWDRQRINEKDGSDIAKLKTDKEKVMNELNIEVSELEQSKVYVNQELSSLSQIEAHRNQNVERAKQTPRHRARVADKNVRGGGH